MPGNPVRRKPEIVDLDAPALIPGGMTRREELEEGRRYRAAMEAYLATMPKGDILDVIRTPFNVIGNSMAGLGAEMLGKSKDFEKYAYTPKTQAEMKALEAMMAVMGPPMELMDYLKIPPIGPGLPTLAGAMRGVDTAAVRLSQKQAAEAARRAGQAVKKAATSDDMAYAIENLAQKAGFGPKQIMMGENSKTWNHGNAALAAHMELQGADPVAIWRATGTFRGADGKLRQEIPDWAMAFTPKAARQRQVEAYTRRRDRALAAATTPEETQDIKEFYRPELKNSIYNLKGKTSEFIDHPELRAAYPELFNREFKQLEPDHPEFTSAQNVSGFFDPKTKAITLNGDFPENDQRDTALHELQHAVQQIEGWQGGASPALMSLKMFQRDQAKDNLRVLERSLEGMRNSDPIKYASQIQVEEQMLKKAQDELNKTKQLENISDPFRAYERVSGEEEARAVERRSRMNDEELKNTFPENSYDHSFKKHITEFAGGGEVHMAGGGFLDMMAKAAKQGVTRAQRLAMTNKDVARRIPALEEAIAALERGEITKQQYAQLVQAYKPVAPYETFFNPEPDEKIIGALTKTNREKEGTRPKQSYFGVPSSTLKRGDKAATRQDIPSYTEADTWVVTAHQPQQGKRVYAGAGPRIGYEPVAMLNDVRFEVQPNAAMKIAKGGQKGTIATMEGYWEPITRELAEEMGPELMRDPRWVQVGMDPTRSASFYNRETMQPILEGEQVLHSGPLVLVKNPRYGDIEDFPFKEGGEVRAAKGGILGALAKTAEAGIERAAKTAKAMQQVLPAAEREANLAKFLEPSAVQMRLYHGTPATEGGKGTEAIRRIKPSKEGALGSGSYLTPDPRYTSWYANEGDANVLPVYAQLKNPLKIEGKHGDPMIEALVKLGMDEDQAARMVEKAYEGPGYIGKQVQNRAQAAGYDGLVQYRDGSPSEVVVYNPNAIKSAIGNQGTYDIYNPELNRAAGGGVTIDEFLKRMKEK